MRGLYFLKHGLAETQAQSLHQALQESLAPIGLQSYETKDGTDPAISALRACQKIYLSTLGIFDLSAPEPESYLEIGLSLGLNKPALIIAGQGITSSIPSVLERAKTWFYRPPLKPNKDLQRTALSILERASQANQTPEETNEDSQVYCVVCGRLCKGWRKQTHGKGYLVLDGTHPQWNALRDTLRSGLAPTGLTPIYLSELKGRVMPLLCEMRLAVSASEFVVLDCSAPCDPEQYIVLGMAISMRRPWLLVTSQPDCIPHLLRQASRLEYANKQDLEQRLEQYVMRSLYPTKYAAVSEATAQLELPFWLQLDDWIARFQVHTSRTLKGALQLLLTEEGQLKQRCRMTPDMTISAGRDSECDLVIEAQAASRIHAEFSFTGQELFVVDQQSTNGTFVNGNQAPPETEISLEINDRVRIGPAEIIVWDEEELPNEVNRYLPESGRITPQTIFVSLSDGLVLADGKLPVARLSSSEINLLEFMHARGKVTTTTNEAAEIIFGTEKVSRMIVSSAIDALRAKIEPSPSDPRFLLAVPGVGYRLRTRGGQLVLGPR
jgi:hypothetical protein